MPCILPSRPLASALIFECLRNSIAGAYVPGPGTLVCDVGKRGVPDWKQDAMEYLVIGLLGSYDPGGGILKDWQVMAPDLWMLLLNIENNITI